MNLKNHIIQKQALKTGRQMYEYFIPNDLLETNIEEQFRDGIRNVIDGLWCNGFCCTRGDLHIIRECKREDGIVGTYFYGYGS